jgi:hypothetical protein
MLAETQCAAARERLLSAAATPAAAIARVSDRACSQPDPAAR